MGEHLWYMIVDSVFQEGKFKYVYIWIIVEKGKVFLSRGLTQVLTLLQN